MQDTAQPRKMAGAIIATLTVIIAGSFLSPRATAQETRVIGGHGGPSVEVDLSVLESLPPIATLPDLLRPHLLPYANSTSNRLPFRGERDRPRFPSSNGVRTVPRPVAKPSAPRSASAGISRPISPIVRPATVPTKPRTLAKSTLSVPDKPKIRSVAPPPPPRESKPIETAATRRTEAPKAQLPPKAPIIASKAPTPPKPKPVQTAARTSPEKAPPKAESKPTSSGNGDSVQLLFDEGQSSFEEAMGEPLGVLIKNLKTNNKHRVQLLAYAASVEGNASKARRLSLSRALSVRAYLMAKGIESTRMDVRALGGRNKSGPANRVDVMVQAPR
jgi:outer membrane protein OmpA-like peptidoglycan-associated protein